MAKKIIFCILDTSGLIAKNSYGLEPWSIFEFINLTFIKLMRKHINSKSKKRLYDNIRALTCPVKKDLFKYFEFYLE